MASLIFKFHTFLNQLHIWFKPRKTRNRYRISKLMGKTIKSRQDVEFLMMQLKHHLQQEFPETDNSIAYWMIRNALDKQFEKYLKHREP